MAGPGADSVDGPSDDARAAVRAVMMRVLLHMQC